MCGKGREEGRQRPERERERERIMEADTYYSHSKLTLGGYICPRCKSKVCELPSDCDICGLTLVSSPHLARSYHHLFPVDNFDEVKPNSGRETHCFSCLTEFADKTDTAGKFSCLKCGQEFCAECDIFVHEVLHNCPGCWSVGQKKKI